MGQEVKLTDHPAQDRRPAWSPDGRFIAFESDREGQWDLFLMPADGGEARRLTAHDADDRSPAWHPDGDRLLFESNREGNLDLYLLTLKTGETRPLTRNPVDEFMARFSPDGGRIAFCARVNDAPQLFLMASNGTLRRQLTETPYRSLWPAWSADGKALTFFSRRDSEGQYDELYTLSLESGALTRLTRVPRHDFCPALSHDGQLAWASSRDGGRPEIYAQRSGGEPRRLTVNEDGDTEPHWSPDGKKLAFAAWRNGHYDIHVIHVE